jgi:hypothetical protein
MVNVLSVCFSVYSLATLVLASAAYNPPGEDSWPNHYWHTPHGAGEPTSFTASPVTTPFIGNPGEDPTIPTSTTTTSSSYYYWNSPQGAGEPTPSTSSPLTTPFIENPGEGHTIPTSTTSSSSYYYWHRPDRTREPTPSETTPSDIPATNSTVGGGGGGGGGDGDGHGATYSGDGTCTARHT